VLRCALCIVILQAVAVGATNAHTRAYYGCVSRDGSVPRWADVIVTNGAKVGVLVAGTAGTAALAMPVVGCSGSGACSGSGGGVCSLPLPCVSTGGDTMVNQ